MVVGGLKPDQVTDVTLAQGSGTTSLIATWTQVDDGTGAPAWYRLKYTAHPDRIRRNWREANIGCDRTMIGGEVGATMSCEIEGLEPGTLHDVQLKSLRTIDGVWVASVSSNVATRATDDGVDVHRVEDLDVTGVTSTTITVTWTQVDDGTGLPAWYRVKYGPPPLYAWGAAAIGCDRTIVGTGIGTPTSCTIEGLEPGTTYDIRLRSFRMTEDGWADSYLSNRVSGTTAGG